MTSDLSGNSRIGGPIRVATLGGGVGSLMGDVHRLSLQLAGGYDLVAGCFSDLDLEQYTTFGNFIHPTKEYNSEQKNKCPILFYLRTCASV